jgi:ABC-type phosphate transport system auxiliary subunit
MKVTVSMLVITLIVIVSISFFSGCEEQVDSRKARLAMAENLELKKQIEQCERQVDNKEDALEQCRTQKDRLQEQINDDLSGMITVMAAAMEQEKEQLQKENKQLKDQIEQLQKKLNVSQQ